MKQERPGDFLLLNKNKIDEFIEQTKTKPQETLETNLYKDQQKLFRWSNQ